jgi:anti-sigma factor RsiW
MKNDPVETRMRELIWRRELTASEEAELRSWLATHPEARAEWETESQLSALMSRLPDVPVSSNFTARVLQAAKKEPAIPGEPAPPRPGWWLRVLVPRAAIAAVVVSIGLVAYERHQVEQRDRLARGVKVISDVPSISNPELLRNFDAIQRLSRAPAPDEELLALMQ